MLQTRQTTETSHFTVVLILADGQVNKLIQLTAILLNSSEATVHFIQIMDPLNPESNYPFTLVMHSIYGFILV